jgi:predicted nucleotidyltransferase
MIIALLGLHPRAGVLISRIAADRGTLAHAWMACRGLGDDVEYALVGTWMNDGLPSGLEKRPDLVWLSDRLHSLFLKKGVLMAVVFGSLATGDSTRRSDLDLIVVLSTDKRFLDRYDDLLSDISLAVPGRDVDLLIYTPEELERMAERPFVRQALQQGVTIYESRQKPARG